MFAEVCCSCEELGFVRFDLSIADSVRSDLFVCGDEFRFADSGGRD